MFVLLWLRILTLLVSTGNVVCLCLIPITTLNLREMAKYTSTCLLNLSQGIYTVGSGNVLDLILSNFSDLCTCITPVDPGLVKPDNYHSFSDYQYSSALCHLY
jgi:hypothetical protein